MVRYLGHTQAKFFDYETKVRDELNGCAFVGARELEILEIAKKLSSLSRFDEDDNRVRRELLARLDKLIASYRSYWTAYEDESSEQGWGIALMPGKLLSLPKAAWQARSDAMQAFWFIEDVLTLALEGRLDLVRQCTVCKRWIVARQENQTLCSKRCRQKEYESRPEVRKRRNEARQERYRAERQRDLKHKRTFEQELETSFQHTGRTQKGGRK